MQMAVRQTDSGPVFLHTLVAGGASHSYGVAVAKLAGIPEKVTSRATEILGEFEHHHTPPIQGKNSENKPTTPAAATSSISSQTQNSIIHQLSSLDLNTLTPLAALNWLSTVKAQLP
jgi:DNA mismatch repair protein MutS